MKQEERRKTRRSSTNRASRPAAPTADSSSGSSDRRSAVFAALLLGLILCLANVAVILSHLDASPEESVTRRDSASLHHHHDNHVRAHQNNVDATGNSNSNNGDESSDNDESGQDDDESNTEAEPEPTVPPITLTQEERLELLEKKEPIMKILHSAGIDDIDDQTLYDLPTWAEVTRLYGDSPRIIGLDTCQAFRNHSDLAEHFVGTAGTFNSGTNLMSEYLIKNCHMTKRMEKYGKINRGIRWQVPWGKHTPVGNDEYRLSHKSQKDHDVDATNILPAVTIRDPYVWMQSMCRIHYKAFWAHDTKSKHAHCPNLVPNEYDLEQFPWLKDKAGKIPVRVKYPEFVQHHDSLVGFWNDWYNDYYNADFPRLIVRFEDLVFHAEEVVTQVCHCAGGEMKSKKFTYIVQSAKKGEAAHGKMEDRTSFIGAMIRYGKDKGRLKSMSAEDLEYARMSLDPKLMDTFNYQYDEINDRNWNEAAS